MTIPYFGQVETIHSAYFYYSKKRLTQRGQSFTSPSYITWRSQ